MGSQQQIPSAPGSNAGPGTPPPDQTTVMFVRFDLHKASRENAPALAWEAEGPIARLVKKIVRRNEGKIAEEHDNVVTAHFSSTLPAISAAETLQRKLQHVAKNPAGKKTAAAVTISRLLRAVHSGTCQEDSPTAVIVCRDHLQDAKPGQILMTEEVFKAAQDAPGFASRAVAAGEAGENGAGKMYELVWAQDQSDSQELPRTDELNVTFSSRYEILSELGRGAMGVVYKAKDRVIGRTVALKTIAVGHDSPDHDEVIERLKLEAKAAGSLDHPNIVTIYDVGNDGDRVYLSMQFVEGATLGKLLSVGKVGSLPTLLNYAEQMCSAVAFAHDRGVIHRDLKPSNIMLTSRGQVKVLDFGIAKLGDAALTQSGMVIGTPAYMAPEQATGKEVDQRSDIFSLGAVFYEMFTGKKPFGADTITAALYKVVHEDPEPPIGVNPSLPNGLDILIRRALNKNPKHRFQSCAQMLNALRYESARFKTEPAHGSSTIRARAGGRKEAPRRPRSIVRNAVQTVIFAGVLVATLAVVLWPQRDKMPKVLQKAGDIKQLAAEAKERFSAHPVKASSATNVNPSAQSKTSAEPAAGSPAGTPTAAPPETVSKATSQPLPQETASISAPPSAEVKPAENSSGQEKKADVQTAAAASPAPAVKPDKINDEQQKGNGEKGAAASGNASDSSDVHSDKAQPQHASTDLIAASKPSSPKISLPPAPPLVVEGFTRKDVPDLMRKADSAAGRGDYPSARYIYNIVIRLDRQNTAARDGLRRTLAAEKERR